MTNKDRFATVLFDLLLLMTKKHAKKGTTLLDAWYTKEEQPKTLPSPSTLELKETLTNYLFSKTNEKFVATFIEWCEVRFYTPSG